MPKKKKGKEGKKKGKQRKTKIRMMDPKNHLSHLVLQPKKLH